MTDETRPGTPSERPDFLPAGEGEAASFDSPSGSGWGDPSGRPRPYFGDSPASTASYPAPPYGNGNNGNTAPYGATPPPEGGYGTGSYSTSAPSGGYSASAPSGGYGATPPPPPGASG
ncbi:MAG: hypothetical protein HOY71_45900, partial [Nonomuraea sp.]|nr:hypothetical protein [Nonomuraea sp.]